MIIVNIYMIVLETVIWHGSRMVTRGGKTDMDMQTTRLRLNMIYDSINAMRNRIERMLLLRHCTIKSRQISGQALWISKTVETRAVSDAVGDAVGDASIT